MQFCGLGVPVARQYYHAKKRSDKSPLDYLYRLNVIALRAMFKINIGSPKIQKEHVEHYIEIVDDPEWTDQSMMLRLADVEKLRKVLKACQKTKARRGKTLFGSRKFGQKVPAPLDRPRDVSCRSVHAVREPTERSGSEGSSLENLDNVEDMRRVYLAEAEIVQNNERTMIDRITEEVDQHQKQTEDPGIRNTAAESNVRCTHCGSRKNGDLRCWKRMTCDHCVKKRHSSDRYFFVCWGWGETHEAGKCQIEDFYNLIRQWYCSTKHAGMLSEKAEKMIN